MSLAFVVELAGVALVLVAVHLVECAQHALLETRILSRREAKLSRLACLDEGSLERRLDKGHVLWRHADAKGILGLGKDIVAIESRGTDVWAVSLLGSLAKPAVEHACGSLLNIVVYQILWCLLQGVGEHVMLEHDVDVVRLVFLVLVDDDDRFGIIRNDLVYDRSWVLWIPDRSEELLYHSLCMVYVYITYDYDTLVLRMIPFLVVVTKLLWSKVVDDRHKAYGIALAILRAWVEFLKVALEKTRAGTCPHTPFLVDNSTFLVNLLWVEGKSICPVAKDEQAGVE